MENSEGTTSKEQFKYINTLKYLNSEIKHYITEMENKLATFIFNCFLLLL